MNGLRSKTQQPSDRSSLDALNRTIEGLEARIEGLMSQKFPRDPRAASAQPEAKSEAYAARAAVTPPQLDPVNEIRQRQRLLEASFQRPQEPTARPERTITRPLAPEYRPRDAQQAAAAPAPRARSIPPYQEPQRNDAALQEIAQALVNLRHELKHDIAEGVAREAQGLRAEIRNIRAVAEDQQFIGDLRDDIARLAGSIDQLGNLASPDAYGLRNEFEDLRLTIDQLAREDSVHRIESRWNNVEDTLRGFDAGALQDEIVSLAYRLDDIKTQLGGMSNNPAVRVLEDKLIAIASAVEQLGKHMQPNEAAFTEQFSGLDQRLDEISRAIAATGTRANAQATDNALAQRLENRLNGLAEQLGDINRLAAAKPEPALDLTARLEALAGKVDELSTARDAAQLHERLDQLSLLLERSQRPSQQAELTSFLSDISRKIDALDHGAVNDGLAERLDLLSRRIEDLDYRYSQPQPASGLSESAFSRLEERLGNIAARLDETAHSAPADSHALASLENQIAHLSTLISQPMQMQAAGMPPELDARMAAIEDYMASNDEYIIEAARQAAEAVLDAYTRNNLSAGANLADMTMLTDLATDLRNLEALSRNTEERTHRTFEALHETLVQIAGRLDNLDNAPVYREEATPRSVAKPVLAPAHEDISMPAAIFPEEGYIAEEQAILDADGKDGDAIVPPAAAKPAKAEKKSLLAGLTKRFKTGTAKTVKTAEEPVSASSSARTQIEPAPSLDPIDVLPAGQENELLEPGSGAPDIKKILERVRASQVAASGKAADAEGRTDFIAAARRAAQAAAMETSPEKLDTGKKGRKAEASGLSRYRRPLLLGIGAILLAMMAMPLVKTLIGGAEAPAPVIEQKQDNGPVSALPEAGDKAVTIPSDLAIDPEQSASADSIENTAPAQNTIDPRTVGGAPLPDEPPVADVPAVDAANSGTVAQNEPSAPAQVAATAVPAQDAITVPAGIEPASLAEAAAKGDTQALFEIAARYTDGRGVAADRTEAAKWYKLAADRGLAPAQYRLANLYEKANGVERNLPEAKRYYTLAAEQGNAGAMHNLAVLLASDAAGQPDFAAAAQWFIKASDLGVRDSQFNLAILYARGSGVKQDIEESYKWFAIAARDGDADAAQKRDEVAGALNPQQLQSAKAKVDAWKVKPLSEDANSVNPPEEWAGKEGVKTASVDMEKAIRNIQAILNKNGFDAGQPDGKLGKNTVTAIKDFQKSVGQTPDGRITNELVTALLARNK
ncbi:MULTISPECIES: cell division protein PodJ [Rhizobium/Agrobacterium group]|uniref:cell division protein PodJ n=1 Tax=Rhizobium/Agrobacterium group TaxID=227290 RepID=UPI000FD955A7|nr:MULTISPECIES: cell division protein PodJ [Rhizobium/Agrobacterium group]MBB4400718.1 localization factor PodJL [Agrobacterium radiobacter]MBB5586873.1 localization factor PodJL [Agrobacterium radiobacter]RVT79338.1 hemagglutinin [Agrobacterium sp. CNPSo 2736]TGE88294.1 hemagglutinin [Rhizobium sp. SEMIA 4032]